MNTIGYMVAAMVVGAMISTQPTLNAILARAIGSAYGAAAISIFVALCFGIILTLLTGAGNISRATLATVPWWVFLAGVVGTIFVAAGPVIAPAIGALLFFVCIVAGQLLGAAIADHFGAFGLAVRELTMQRGAGLALVLVGAILVNRG